MKNQSHQIWLNHDSGNFAAFRELVSRETERGDFPLAETVQSNIPFYDGRIVDRMACDPDETKTLMAEWCHSLLSGPGVICIKAAYSDTSIIDRASELFEAIIVDQHLSGEGAGDHFAAAGANDRIWNSLEKHCFADPENFVRYYANPTLHLASTAWLGPGYQMTAQVNLVRPGGKAQTAHRDYHLGFMQSERMVHYPAHIHDISPVLTLQGGVAHCDMPLESGPTMLLPYSQQFREGYLVFERQEYQDWFAEHYVQVPFEKGDAFFFNPALMHGAGNNVSGEIQRLANLLQVSSPFGRAMETVDRAGMAKTVYPALRRLLDSGTLSLQEAIYAIACTAEGYSFPTNLDRDPPIGGLAPKTPQQMMLEACSDRIEAVEFSRWIDENSLKRLSR